MPTFEEPWGWWINLANLTQWLWWPAWAAVFSLWALLNTARLADRQNHRERRKDAVFVYAAGRLLDDANTSFEELLKEFERGPVKPFNWESALEHFVEYKFEERFADFGTEKFPTLKSMKDFRYATIVFAQIVFELRKAIDEASTPDTGKLFGWVALIEGRHLSLIDQSQKLVSRNEWARLHSETPPYSWAGFTKSLKSFPVWALTTWTDRLWAKAR